MCRIQGVCEITAISGHYRIPISTDGEWMFLVRHKDPTKKVNDMFDESVFVSTLVMQAR